jgi:hypothetical protein
MITALIANMGNGKGDPAAMMKTLTEAVKDIKEVAGDGGSTPSVSANEAIRDPDTRTRPGDRIK